MKSVRFDPPISGVVVGYDGTEHAHRALVWALADAARRGSELHVVQAWRLEDVLRSTGLRDGVVPSVTEFAASVLAELERTVGAERDRAGAAVPVHCHAVEGRAATILLAAAGAADVLVVGERGHGGFAGLVLGSNAEQMARYAPCTVVIARP